VSQRGARSCETVSWEPITLNDVWRLGVAILTDHVIAWLFPTDPFQRGIHMSATFKAVGAVFLHSSHF